MSNPSPMEGFLPQDPASVVGSRYNSPIKNVLIGGGFVLAAGAAIWGMHEGEQTEGRITTPMPFIQEAQEAVNGVDGVLGEVGQYGLVLALGTIGAYKISSRWSPAARAIDRISSKEMTNDGNHTPSAARRTLQNTFAGSIPGIASVGVALGAFTGAIGTEVSEGPSRPIASFELFAPGRSMVVQYEGAMPMVQSSVNAKLTEAVRAEAARRDVHSSPLDLNLGTLTTVQNESFSDLTLGMEVVPGSPLDWQPGASCTTIPIMIDKDAGIDKGAQVHLNGVRAQVVDTLENTSAINRVGVAMDRDALKQCLEQNPESGDHAVVLDTDPATAKEILQTANAELQSPATVITKEDYVKNSEEFWTSNVKPITNMLELASLGAVLISLGGNLRARMLRNRREWASDLARRVSVNRMQAAELLRSAKDGVLSSFIGVAAATIMTPVANTIVSGFQAGVGFKEAMVGVGVGIVGAIGGTLGKLFRPRKLINPREYTR